MSAATELRELLDKNFESREIRDFEEVKDGCCGILKKYCDFLIVFREQRYFETEDTDEDLYFQYFSFGHSSGLGRLNFPDRQRLVDELSEWETRSIEFTSKYCQLYVRETSLDESELAKVFNLIKRIVVFYYLNSGSKAHFLASVSQRMIKSFWKSDAGDRVYTREAAIKFLCGKLEIDAALFAVVDELPGENSPVSECLVLVEGSSSIKGGKIHKALDKNSIVSKNAMKSIGRRNRTTGKFKGITYGMSTISGNHVHVDDNDEVRNHSVVPEYLIVFSGENIGLSVDKIEISTTFLNSVIRTIVDFEEVHYRRQLEHTCRDLERELGENPVATRDQFEKKYISLIVQHSQSDYAVAGLFPTCLRIFRPSSSSLQKIFTTVEYDEETLVPKKIDIADTQAASAYAFRNDETISLWSETKLQRRADLVMKGYRRPTDAFCYQKEYVGTVENLVGQVGHSIIAVPVRINEIIVGTVEFSSPSHSDLDSFIEACEEFASQCGEFYRRLELANDRGWLVRMHFLHAARHRLQHIVNRISDHSTELSNELSDLIAASVVNETGSSGEDDYMPASDCIKLLDERTREAFTKHSGSHATALRDLFIELLHVQNITRRNFILLSEVVEALAANVRKHGFRADCLRVSAGAKCGDVETIVLTYRPDHTYEDKDRTQRVCVSPMPSATGVENGYSYGLFLLATQIRMSGGWMISHAEEPDEFGQSAFGFTVILNAIV